MDVQEENLSISNSQTLPTEEDSPSSNLPNNSVIAAESSTQKASSSKASEGIGLTTSAFASTSTAPTPPAQSPSTPAPSTSTQANSSTLTSKPTDTELASVSILCALKQAATSNEHKLPQHSLANLLPHDEEESSITSLHSGNSYSGIVCRICHNAENFEKLVSPCNCRGTLSHVHIYCLERWISTSRCTTCELCHFQYNTKQTLRYSWFQALRIYYSRNLSRRALQEDCQMFSMLTLVAFGIIGTLLVGLQYYFVQGTWGLAKLWTRGWLMFFLITTMTVYILNVYMIVKAQLTPWYRWWQSARDIKLIIENRHPLRARRSGNLIRRPSSLSLRAQARSEHESVTSCNASAGSGHRTEPAATLQPCNTALPAAAETGDSEVKDKSIPMFTI